MTKPKLLPYINKITGEVKTLPKRIGKNLSSDWARAKMAKNHEGKRVFRFELTAPVRGKDGRVFNGTAVVDMLPVDEKELEVENGKRAAE